MSEEISETVYYLLRSAHWVPNSSNNGTIGCEVSGFLEPKEYQELARHFNLLDRLKEAEDN